jgi:hypothetical protein
LEFKADEKDGLITQTPHASSRNKEKYLNRKKKEKKSVIKLYTYKKIISVKCWFLRVYIPHGFQAL